MRCFQVVLSCGLLCAGLAQGQTARPFADPSELQPVKTPGGVSVTLNVNYATLHAYNLQTGKTDTLHLRTYNGMPVGPTIRIEPGATLDMMLNNQLPKDPPPCKPDEPMHDHNTPNCFNFTNMHTHGLHVSPKGNSDNVLLVVKPGESQPYKFVLPANHPAGTFWYHSHRHGSTALQVSSGMEGALIVDGTRTYADRAKHEGIADIDTVLKQEGGKSVVEHIALFQQVQYSCRNAAGKLVTTCIDADGKPMVGEIEGYQKDQFGPGTWGTSMRYTTINGTVQPTVPAEAGQIYRFRLIHGGVRDTIGLHVTLSDLASDVLPTGLTPSAEQSWVDKHCLKQEVPQFEIAADGLTRTSMSQKIVNVLQPGYRSDVLMVFPKKGLYCVTDDPLLPASEINSELFTLPKGLKATPPVPEERRLLALIEVTGEQVVPDGGIRAYLGSELYKGNPELPEDVRTDLKNLKTAAFSPLPDLRSVAKVEHQTTTFNVDISHEPAVFQIDGKPYSGPEHIDKTLDLGTVDEWVITSQRAGHPFHIHVNAFQIVKITNDKGENIIDSNGKCTELKLMKDGKPAPDPQYCDQIGVFRDTIFIKANYHITMRTHYEDFAGDFVLHCHILDHEDEGMMQNIRIDDPKHPNTGLFGNETMQMDH